MKLKTGFSLKHSVNSGFSLIELLIGIGLLGMLLATGTVLLFSSLRSSRKAAAVGVARSEGAAALNGMAGMIRYAQNLTSVCTNSVSLVRSNGDDITYILRASGTDRWVASESSRLPAPGTIRLTSNRVAVTNCPAQPTLFTCPDPATVNICFVVSSAVSTDVSDTESVTFRSQVTLRNLGQ